MNTTHDTWKQLTPVLVEPERGLLIDFINEASALFEDDPGPASAERAEQLDLARDEYVARGADECAEPARVEAMLYVLTDILKQGRALRYERGRLEYEAQIVIDEDCADDRRSALRALRRGQLLVARDQQLKQQSVRDFIASMERRRLHGSSFTSIFSLMRDGRELSEELRVIRDATDDLSLRAEALREVVDPYIQVIQGDEVCEHTGLKLRDIWRYFRHTWTTVYKTTPGRSMSILIRDRAASNHPVVGIAALSSPIMQTRARDLWIGWHSECINYEGDEGGVEPLVVDLERLGWLKTIVSQGLNDIYIQDFVEEGLFQLKELEAPSSALLKALGDEAEAARGKHKQHGTKKSSSVEDDDVYWEKRSRSHLYRSKRAEALSRLLRARQVLNKLEENPSEGEFKAWRERSESVDTVKYLLRKAKADRVGICLADISVCGAVAPYNDLIGGKLVCMLLASPEVVAAYRSRYVDSSSIIASSIAGRQVRRPAELVLLSTTSLYGRSNQYNRVVIPSKELGQSHDTKLRYEEIGQTEGYGTDQFSAETVEVFDQLISQSNDGQRINSMFGEGINPRLRKIRQGLDLLDMPSDALLVHGASRSLYTVALAHNFRAYLLGEADQPDYILKGDPDEVSAQIAHWWRRRWLAKRIRLDYILDRVQGDALIHPITHRARVMLPPGDSKQVEIFSPYE